MDWAMDFGENKTLDELDHGGRAPDGYHRAKLVSLTDDEDGNKRLTFEVVSAKAKGAKQTEKLSNPILLDGDKAPKAAARNKTIATRLGLVTADMIGRKDALIRWDSAVGREYVIKVETRKMPVRADGGGGGEFTGLAYAGIFPLDHPDIPAAVRVELQLPAAKPKHQAASAAPAASAVDIDKLFGK